MKIQSIVGIIAAFIIIGMLAFLGINWVSTIPAPTNTSSPEYQQYTNMTDTVDLAFTAQEGVLLLIAVALVFAAIIVFCGYVLKVV